MTGRILLTCSPIDNASQVTPNLSVALECNCQALHVNPSNVGPDRAAVSWGSLRVLFRADSRLYTVSLSGMSERLAKYTYFIVLRSLVINGAGFPKR